VPESFQKALQALNFGAEETRKVKEAKICYMAADARKAMDCVWCGKTLTVENLHIDHLLPYSQTKNNELWNLVPSCIACNAGKSDAIPTPKMIRTHQAAIVACWEKEKQQYPEAFVEEIRYSLTGYEDMEFNAEKAVMCLEKRCEFLIEERGYAPWEKN
jgi:CRISPR/Cas system Type II protein with McrA/HNH and RuvC-like nuclease domain